MPRQYFFWKYLNTIIVLYCIIVQKNPIFVQLSHIQCTYSNIFIRFFKFFPANANIYQNSYRVNGVLCGLRVDCSSDIIKNSFFYFDFDWIYFRACYFFLYAVINRCFLFLFYVAGNLFLYLFWQRKR